MNCDVGVYLEFNAINCPRAIKKYNFKQICWYDSAGWNILWNAEAPWATLLKFYTNNRYNILREKMTASKYIIQNGCDIAWIFTSIALSSVVFGDLKIVL